MRIFSKKAFLLKVADDAFLTKAFAFLEMPDVFSNSQLFQWAVRDGDIEVVGAPRQREIESAPGEPTVKRAKKTKANEAGEDS